jgi:hypothetical protein
VKPDINALNAATASPTKDKGKQRSISPASRKASSPSAPVKREASPAGNSGRTLSVDRGAGHALAARRALSPAGSRASVEPGSGSRGKKRKGPPAQNTAPIPKALHLRLAGIRLPLGPTLPCNPSMPLSSVALEAQHRPLRDIPLHLPRNTKLEARSPRLEPRDQLHLIHLEARASTLAVTEVLRLHLPVKAVLLQAPADAPRAGGQRNRPCRRRRSRRKCPGCESLHTLVRSLREWFVTCSLPQAVPSTVDSFGKLLPDWSLPT